MADDTTSKYTLNLDAEQFTSAAKDAAGALTGIREAGESIGVLVETLEHVGLAIGVVTVAFIALEKIIEAVFEGEKIKQTEAQFRSLAQAAGVYSETLKKGLEDASGGWATDTELMQHANKALVELEVGAERLPELMDAAKKATTIMGGNFLDNFDAMSKAVASGNTRQLRNLGIVIDQQKAYREYAQSIGATVETLSLAGKQEAILEAVLAKTSEKFKDQGEDVRVNTSLWIQAKVAFQEVYEAVALLIEKLAGSTLAKFFMGVKEGAESMKTAINAALGTGHDKVQALNKELDETNAQIAKLEKQKLTGFGAKETQDQIDGLKRRAQEYEAEIKKTQSTDSQYLKEEKQKHAQEMAMSEQKTKTLMVDNEKVAKQRADFAKEAASVDKQIADIDKQLTAEEIKEMQSVDQATKLYNKQKLAMVQETEAKITQIKAQQAQIRAKYGEGKISQAQELALLKKTDQQIVQLNKLKDKQMITDDQALAKMQNQALDQYQAHAENVFQGVGRSFEVMTEKNKRELADWGAFGTMTTNAFSTSAVSSIQAWATGTKSATEAMEGMFAGMVGKMATQYGEMMLLASILPPDPIGMAGGTALIALGSVLSGMAGSAGTSGGSVGATSIGAGGSGGGGGSMNAPSSNLPTTTAAQTNNGGSSVHLTVQGSIFDTQATQTRIADLVRTAQDSTDFSIAKVGGGI